MCTLVISCFLGLIRHIAHSLEQVLAFTLPFEDLCLVFVLDALDVFLHYTHRCLEMLFGCLQVVLVVHGLSVLIL